MDRRWKLAAVTGWAAAGLMLATATKLVRELRAVTPPYPVDDPERVRASARTNGRTAPPWSAREWGEHLANEAKALVMAGHENQATYLHAAAGQLLEAAEAGPS